jgi:hypothetical protein
LLLHHSDGAQKNQEEIEISLLTKITAPGGHIQITIMIDTQQQYMKLNIRGEISIILKGSPS